MSDVDDDAEAVAGAHHRRAEIGETPLHRVFGLDIAELVRPIASLSQPAADDFDEPIELLFVDGSHEYDLVLEDFEKWVPKVVDGGWIAFHDTTWTAGPRKVVGDAIYRSRRFKDVRFVVGSTTVARKVQRNSFPDRLDLKDEHVLWARRHGVKFAVDTDSHSTVHLGFMRFGVGTAQRGWLTKDDVINAWPLQQLRTFVSAKRSR